MTSAAPRPQAGRERRRPRRAAPKRAGAGLMLAALGAGALAVLALWWPGTPAVAGLGGRLAAAGWILGLLAGSGAVALMVLLAGLPPLERALGAGRLDRWRAAGGRSVTGLVLAHVVLVTWGYSVSRGTRVIAGPGTLLDGYPEVLLATVAVAVLVWAGAASARRLQGTGAGQYLPGCAAVVLAFSHQLADGGSDASGLPARIGWPALYLAVAALAAWHRVVVPLRTAARCRFRVVGVRQEAPGTVSVYIAGQHLDQLRVQPGQFVRWRFLARECWRASYPGPPPGAPGAPLRIVIRRRGHSRQVALPRPGTRVIAEGPYGSAVPVTTRPILLLAAEPGIMALRALLAAVPAAALLAAEGITLINVTHGPGDSSIRRQLDDVAAACGATVHTLTWSGDQPGGSARVAQRLRALVPGLHRYEAYLSGPPAMTSIAITALTAAGIPGKRIHRASR